MGFQHMIEKESALDIIYNMHFPKEVFSIDTQTAVTWINELENLEQSIAKIEENIEIVSEPALDIKTKKKALTSVPEPDLEEEKTPEQDMKGDAEYDLTLSPTTSEIGANPDVPESMLTSPTQDENTSEQEAASVSSINNLTTDENSPMEKIDEDDDPVIIHEKKIDYSDANFSLEKEIKNINDDDDQPIIIKQKKTDISDSDSCSSLSEMPIAAVEDTNMDYTELSEETDGNKIENVKEAYSTWTRYKCPYCEFIDYKKHVVDDHIIITHSEAKYGDAKKQEMFVGIQRDSSLAALLQVHYHNYVAALTSDKIIDNSKEEVVLGDFAEVDDEISSNIEESFTEEEIVWQPCDAMLPNGWLYADCLSDEGDINKTFMSPCKREFSSRDEVSEFLMDQGKKRIKICGFKVPNAEKSKCDGMCEGNCKIFVVPKSFYRSNDENKKRKKTKLKFINDSQVSKANRIKDKLAKGVPKIKPIQGKRFQKPIHNAARPYI